MVNQRNAIRDLLLIGLLDILIVSNSLAQIAFEEVTIAAGISYSGPSFGSSWGDFNSDGRPDLWVGSHGEAPRLYINTAGGQFQLLPGTGAYTGDNHGAAWADFDNDGDQDLLMLNGGQAGTGSDPNRLLVNTTGQLFDRAAGFGLDYSLGRGRTPLWFDWNNDGFLDVFLSNFVRSDGEAPSTIFTRRGDLLFSPENGLTGILTTESNTFAQLGWSSAIDRPLLMVHKDRYPETFLRFDALPFQQVPGASAFPTTGVARDVAFRDFDGNGQEDFFVVRAGDPRGSVLANGVLRGTMLSEAAEVGVLFQGGANWVQFSFEPKWLVKRQNIFFGSQGINPAATTFQLSADNPDHQGIAARGVGDELAIYVGYIQSSGHWEIYASSPDRFLVNYVVVSEQDITAAADVNMIRTDGAQPDQLLLSIDGQLVDVSDSANISARTACESAAAADFDNDMDIDIYLVCRNIVGNAPNRMLMNNGDGTFSQIGYAAGAAGSTVGMGESVSSADYDLDGFIDLFVTNGRGSPPFGSGPDQLFRNRGNGNNWLELDFIGLETNRDGIGARIEVLAGGDRQVRLVDGGMHRVSQNHARLHFGLAGHQVVDEIIVNWPSGSRQRLTDVGSNQILEIVECTGPISEDDIMSTDRGQPFSADLLENDICLGNTPIVLDLGPLSNPAAGTLTVDANSNEVTLLPAADFAGQLSFAYTVSDARMRQDTALVSVRVNDLPEAVADSASVAGGDAIEIDVLGNDRGLSDGVAQLSVITNPKSGASVNVNNEWVVYIAPEKFIGTDSFEYAVTDTDGDSSTAVVMVEVQQLPESPADSGGEDPPPDQGRGAQGSTGDEPATAIDGGSSGSALDWLTLLLLLLAVCRRSVSRFEQAHRKYSAI